MAFNLSMNASEIDKTLVESRRLLDSDPATKQYVDEKVANAGGSADLSEILEETEATTWTTKGEEAAIIVPMYDGGTVSLYKMPSAVGTVLPQEIEVTTKEVYDDGYVNEDVYLTEAHEAFRGEGVTLFDLQPVGIIAVVTKAGTVDFTDAQVEISEPGVYFYDKRSWENPIEGVQYATMKFTTPYSEVRLKESILPSTAATKQYVDEKATWESLPDKPFGEVGGDTLTWDGNTEGLVSVSGAFYKVSDAIPTMDDFANGFGAVMNGSYAEGSADNVGNPVENIIVAGGIYIVSSPGAELDGLVFPETGVYFMHVPGNMEVTSFTINGYTGFPSVKTIDEKYLPESVKGGSGGGALYVAFSSEDGSTFAADKTFAEIEAAYSSGGVVTGQITTMATGLPTLVPLTQVYTGMGVIFSTIVFPSSGSTAIGVHVMVGADNSVAVSHYGFEVTKQ